MKKNNFKYTRSDEKYIRKNHAEITAMECAKHLNVSDTTAKRWADLFGVEFKVAKMSNFPQASIDFIRDNGHKYNAFRLAQILNTTSPTIRKYAALNSVKLLYRSSETCERDLTPGDMNNVQKLAYCEGW